jgi:hypothetical protein
VGGFGPAGLAMSGGPIVVLIHRRRVIRSGWSVRQGRGSVGSGVS